MEIRWVFVLISAILAAVGAVPYIIGILRNKTKPRVITWIIWTTLGMISCAASLVEKQYSTALLLAAVIIGNICVIILGWEHEKKRFEKLDIFCAFGAVLGLILWWIFNSPAVAVISTVVIDGIGAIPTLRHSWRNPKQEELVVFIFQFIGDIFALLAIQSWRITAFAYPLYALIINFIFSYILIYRRSKLKKRHARSSVSRKSYQRS